MSYSGVAGEIPWVDGLRSAGSTYIVLYVDEEKWEELAQGSTGKRARIDLELEMWVETVGTCIGKVQTGRAGINKVESRGAE